MNNETDEIQEENYLGYKGHAFEFTDIKLLDKYTLLIWHEKEEKIFCTTSTATFPDKYISAYMIDTRYKDPIHRHGTVSPHHFWIHLDYSTFPDKFKTLLMLLGV